MDKRFWQKANLILAAYKEERETLLKVIETMMNSAKFRNCTGEEALEHLLKYLKGK